MRKINSLIVFSTEDSSKPSSWSNVPYLFTETLMHSGVEVKRVQIKEIIFFRFLFNCFKKLLKILFKFETSFEFSRTAAHFYYSQFWMNRACKKYKYDAVFVINCSYAPSKYGGKPLILFCDWSYDYYIQYFLNRKPDCLERKSLHREKTVIEKADFVFVLFPVVQEYMKKNFLNQNFFYIGNVINAVDQPSQLDIEIKKTGKALLFIGKSHYKEGADQLISAFRVLKQRIPDLELNIVGMESSSFDDLPADTHCHGYLDKGTDSDRKKYYELLRKSALFVNTNPKWASFSATLEAMYFYTPIITSNYPEMNRTFGDEICFGVYFQDDDAVKLAERIENILLDSEYENLCLNAHSSVKNYTWDNYVTKFLSIVAERKIYEKSY